VSSVFEKRLILVWLALSAVTLVSVWMGLLDDGGAPTPNAAITSSAIAIALVKTRVIFREFMEVRHAPALLCRLTDGWLLLTGVCLLGAYFGGMAARPG
jgi:Prokaryotic Cytochrome C oxidase subunit IV